MENFITPRKTDLAESATPPTLEQVKANKKRLQPYVLTTPVWETDHASVKQSLGADARLFFKLELWQHTGTFKPRGAITTLLDTDSEKLKQGIVAVSAGNHAMAASFAAKKFNASAKVLMPKTASPIRIAKCKEYGADVILMGDIPSLFPAAEKIVADERRVLIHPFEGPSVSLGTATVGLEICEQLKDFDAVVVSVGGGGLISGIASYCKQFNPEIEIYGVEPVGAKSMSESFVKGSPVHIDKINTIADSLSSPMALPYSFSLSQQFVDGIGIVTDTEIKQAMQWLFDNQKLAVEPAAAAALAGIFGPLNSRLQNKKIVMVVCGTNIDASLFCQLLNSVK